MDKRLHYRNANVIDFRGERHTISDWSRITGIDRGTLTGRVKLGWTVEQVLITPEGTQHKAQHGHSVAKKTSPTYRSWMGMIQRCENQKQPAYARYGGRGIRIYPRWHKFENFLADMGKRPTGLTLERVDNDGNYDPANCVWADRFQQASNKANNRFLEFEGKRHTVAQWARIIGVSKQVLFDRLRRMTTERALTQQLEIHNRA